MQVYANETGTLPFTNEERGRDTFISGSGRGAKYASGSGQNTFMHGEGNGDNT